MSSLYREIVVQMTILLDLSNSFGEGSGVGRN